MQIYTKAFISLSVLLATNAFSQEQVKDTTTTKLEEVVVTGQFEPQSLKKSVHNVRVISKEDMKRLAANNLGDVLNQYLNISIRSSGSDGRSSVSMFGLDSQYFKILMDNIPLVSDTGLGTNVDLTQVNLDDIEQIEIIEGSMGVTHGANAVTGILNIITKKSSKYKWEITASAQEETISDEFAFFDKGRHIQNAKVSHNFSENFFGSIGGSRNDFAGFFDGQGGKEQITNDNIRGYKQLPKEQLVGNALFGYNKNDFRIFYKFDYFGENVDYYNPVVIPITNYPFPDTHYSADRRYITNRYYHHLNSYGKLFSQLTYNVSVSHQKQERDVEKFNYYIESDNERFNDRVTYQKKEVVYSTGTINNFFKDKRIDLQLGYEAVNEKGFFDATAGTFRDENQQIKDVRQRLENYDIFTVAEIRFTDKFSLRPGIRHSFQSFFKDQQASSLGIRYLFSKGIEARGSLGKSYRTPNFDELYTYLVDANHNLQGNPNLIPEESTSYEASIKKATYFKSGLEMSNNLAVTYLDVNDRISLVMTQFGPPQEYQYANIDKYKMWNISSTHQFSYKNLNAKVGVSYVGISQVLDLADQNLVSDDKFLYSLQLNTNLAYNVPKWNTLFSVFYKFNGKQQQYAQTTNTNSETEFFLSEIESFGMMDASIRKSFYNNKFEVTVGGRNLLDVTTLQQTQGTAGVHTATSDYLFGYGRSYYLKLTYNLNFN